jgi:hypothetical protein
MALDVLVREVGRSLGDARGLFGPTPQSGGWSSDSGLGAARDGVSQAGGAASATWSGAAGSRYVTAGNRQITALHSVIGADQATQAGIDGGTDAAAQGGAGMDGVIDDTRAGVAAIAPTTGTAAGKQALVTHLQGQLHRAKVLLQVSERRNVALAAMIRDAAGGYRGGLGGLGGSLVMSGAAPPGGLALPNPVRLAALTHHRPSHSLAHARPAGHPSRHLAPPAPGDKAAVASYIYQAALARGYSPEEATAIVAYSIGESDLVPTISGGPQGGSGAADEVIGLFQEKPGFAQDGGVAAAQRYTVEGNVEAYLNNLARHRDAGDIYQQLLATSSGGPMFTGGYAAMGPLLARARQYLGA